MKLQDITLAAAVAVTGIFAIQHVRAEDNVAACCSDFNGECYTASNNRSNDHACNSCNPPACHEECGQDPTTEACQACCVTYPQHEKSWECPVQSVTCFADQYGVGNYSDYHFDNQKVCPDPVGNSAGFEYDLSGNTVEACIAACEASGMPGCCEFQEILDTVQNTSSASHCRFRSSTEATFARLKIANGTEPIARLVRRLLVVDNTKRFFRGVRCDKDEPETNSPSTDGPTTQGTNTTEGPTADGGATQTSTSIAVVVAVVAALKAL